MAGSEDGINLTKPLDEPLRELAEAGVCQGKTTRIEESHLRRVALAHNVLKAVVHLMRKPESRYQKRDTAYLALSASPA